MALFNVNQIVYANCTIQTDACGDHPCFVHARRGDKLYVIEYKLGAEHPYLLSGNPDGTEPFWAKASELMGQKPFNHGY